LSDDATAYGTNGTFYRIMEKNKMATINKSDLTKKRLGSLRNLLFEANSSWLQSLLMAGCSLTNVLATVWPTFFLGSTFHKNESVVDSELDTDETTTDDQTMAQNIKMATFIVLHEYSIRITNNLDSVLTMNNYVS